ncbi:predicted protein [Sclerotinia sclerotiorum 1980 UF-70]|uniref:Uncharacterized protein n=2 Tax=Sclerotinia sclerotiorum (strain ATCC 18683 / 1980 / Ss-1) TaxID=665079 RepID=A7ERY3_SCLS1|nr:predicted protein [Sclerotinia sclerotiorum 1980 UF-70]APA13332.1 hypothetical protein sscle_11g081020 [Sclerotinia sclerotiorum 1980 UF-70]EDN92225.1 predicted protein [Sclerotinia sclerotiorum 1980 UF-70]
MFLTSLLLTSLLILIALIKHIKFYITSEEAQSLCVKQTTGDTLFEMKPCGKA